MTELKYRVRIFALWLERATSNFIVPVTLFNDISTNCKDPIKLLEIREEIRILKQKFPKELELIRAEATVERMLVIGK